MMSREEPLAPLTVDYCRPEQGTETAIEYLPITYALCELAEGLPSGARADVEGGAATIEQLFITLDCLAHHALDMERTYHAENAGDLSFHESAPLQSAFRALHDAQRPFP